MYVCIYVCMYQFQLSRAGACARYVFMYVCISFNFPGQVRARAHAHTHTVIHTRLRKPAAAAIAERLLTASSPAICTCSMRTNTDKTGHRNLSERDCRALVPPLMPRMMGPPRGGKRARTRMGVELLTRATERALTGRIAPGEKASAPEACTCIQRVDGANGEVSRVRDTVRERFRISRGRCGQRVNKKTDNAVATAILQPKTTLRTTSRRCGAVGVSPGDARRTARLRGAGHWGVRMPKRADMCASDAQDAGYGPGTSGAVR